MTFWTAFDHRAPNIEYHVLLDAFGWTVRLHRINSPDGPWFHSHPADYSLRIILKGGYEEHFPTGQVHIRRPGHMSIVKHSLSHRIVRLLHGPSISLWIRSPKRHKVEVIDL